MVLSVVDEIKHWVLPVLCRKGIQWTRELAGQASGVRQEGVNPGTFGSSGICVRKLSRFSLNSSVLIFVRLRISLGSALKSLGPTHWKLESLKDRALGGPFNLLTEHFRPFLLLYSSVISSPQFGTMFSITFQQ